MAKVVTYFTSRTSLLEAGSGEIIILGLIGATRPRLATVWKYSKAELRPPTFGEFPEVAAGIGKLVKSAKTGGYKNLTVKEAWLNTLVGAEIAFWFFAGECIGKFSLVGYNIPGAVNWDIHF